uniref:(northern house mosquito) hypothetical protein n=1 Tax=Culex pipiens TaxID=7175 RepID=A0A8D8DCE1_CULPI
MTHVHRPLHHATPRRCGFRNTLHGFPRGTASGQTYSLEPRTLLEQFVEEISARPGTVDQLYAVQKRWPNRTHSAVGDLVVLQTPQEPQTLGDGSDDVVFGTAVQDS